MEGEHQKQGQEQTHIKQLLQIKDGLCLRPLSKLHSEHFWGWASELSETPKWLEYLLGADSSHIKASACVSLYVHVAYIIVRCNKE